MIVESKQIRNGTVQLNPNGAGGYTRMSEDWIRQVITNLSDNHLYSSSHNVYYVKFIVN